MDIIDVGTTPETQPIADELQAGQTLTVSSVLLFELREFADRDDDPTEHAAYRRLLRKALRAGGSDV